MKVPKAAAGDVHPRRPRPILVSVVVAVVALSCPLVLQSCPLQLKVHPSEQLADKETEHRPRRDLNPGQPILKILVCV